MGLSLKQNYSLDLQSQNAQVVQACWHLAIALLQVLNSLDASCQQTCCRLISSTGLLRLFQQVVTSLQVTSLTLTDLLQLDEIDKLVDKLQQAGKIDNLQQVCGVFGCVLHAQKIPVHPRFKLIAETSWIFDEFKKRWQYTA